MAENNVEVSGKITRTSGVKYTPSGLPVVEFTIAVPQQLFEKVSIGYYQAQLSGRMAEDIGNSLKIGKKVSVKGSLWNRNYKDRQGRLCNETKILVNSLE